MSTVQLTTSKIVHSHIQTHTSTQKYEVILAKELKQHITNKHRKYGFIGQEKSKILCMERIWTDRQYHVQDNADVEHNDVKMYCNTNQFPELSFCGLHSKSHGARGLSKHYHLRFDPKLGMGICEIRRIPCDFFSCTSMLDKLWITGIPPDEQERYKPTTKSTYWPVLGSFNNWNMIQLSHNSTPSETFDEIHQVVLDGTSDNMASLVESG